MGLPKNKNKIEVRITERDLKPYAEKHFEEPQPFTPLVADRIRICHASIRLYRPQYARTDFAESDAIIRNRRNRVDVLPG